MNKIRFVLILVSLFVSFSIAANAQDATSPQKCMALEKQISEQLNASQVCKEDGDCAWQFNDCPLTKCGGNAVNATTSKNIEQLLKQFSPCVDTVAEYKQKNDACKEAQARKLCAPASHVACINQICQVKNENPAHR